MTTDRDLLVCAAAAADIRIAFFHANGSAIVAEDGGGPESCLVTMWNPLLDDGQALRLAVRVGVSITMTPCDIRTNTIFGALRNNFFVEDTVHQDYNSACRRAIVRAAAEVGENGR